MTKLERYDNLFEDYLQNIALTHEQASKIDDAMEDSIALFMAEYNDLEIYAQGSYAMGTLVRPLTEQQSGDGVAGDYDIDLALQRENWGGAKNSLNEVKEILLGAYNKDVDRTPHNSCERVYHYENQNTGVNFHADYVPIKYESERRAASRRDDRWFPSDTKQLVRWFHIYCQGKPFLQALIIMLKRIRDYAGLTSDLPSICITCIVCDGYADKSSYAGDLLWAVGRIFEIFKLPLSDMAINLPTTGENLTPKITETGRQKVLGLFSTLKKVLEDEFLNKKMPDLANLRRYLSDAFPHDISKYPECLESLRSQGFSMELDGSLKIFNLEEDENKQYRSKSNLCQFGEKGRKLKFLANVPFSPPLYGSRWQVLNAAGSAKRRGNLFEARSKSGNEGRSEDMLVNWETESYDGIHWIKCYIFDKRTKKVVAISRKFYVDVVLS